MHAIVVESAYCGTVVCSTSSGMLMYNDSVCHVELPAVVRAVFTLTISARVALLILCYEAMKLKVSKQLESSSHQQY